MKSPQRVSHAVSPRIMLVLPAIALLALTPGCTRSGGEVDAAAVPPPPPPPPPPSPPPPISGGEGMEGDSPCPPSYVYDDATSSCVSSGEAGVGRNESSDGLACEPDEVHDSASDSCVPTTGTHAATAIRSTDRPISRAPAAAAAGLAYCPALEDLASEEECRAFTQLRDNSPLGVASLGAPTRMELREFYPVTLIVGREERRERIERAAGALGQVSTETVRLAPWICAELDATGFEIRGEREQCKKRRGSPQVSFDWEVSPGRSGPLSLAATIRSLTDENGEMLEQIDSNRVEVEVKAGFNDIVDDATESGTRLRDLLLVIAAIVAAISLIVWRVRRIGQKPEAGGPG